MRTHARHPVTMLLALAALAHAACAGGPPLTRPTLLPVPPSEELRATLGRMAIVAARFAPAVKVVGPARGAGEGAGRGAGTGAAIGAAPAASGNPYAVILALLTAPIGAAVGAVTGAARARRPEELEPEFASLVTAINGRDVQDCLRTRTESLARRWSSEIVERRPDVGPKTVDEAADYRALQGEGIDTVLEVVGETVAIDGWGIRSPDTTLLFAVRTRLVRVRDNAELYGHRILFRSPAERWQKWVTAGAALVGEQLDRACEALGERVADEVLSVYFAPSWRPAQ